jgi:hypothetical protein
MPPAFVIKSNIFGGIDYLISAEYEKDCVFIDIFSRHNGISSK